MLFVDTSHPDDPDPVVCFICLCGYICSCWRMEPGKRYQLTSFKTCPIHTHTLKWYRQHILLNLNSFDSFNVLWMCNSIVFRWRGIQESTSIPWGHRHSLDLYQCKLREAGMWNHSNLTGMWTCAVYLSFHYIMIKYWQALFLFVVALNGPVSPPPWRPVQICV